MGENHTAAASNAKLTARPVAIMGMALLVIAALASFVAVAPAQGATEQPGQAAALESGTTVSGQQPDAPLLGQALETQASNDGPQVGVAVPGDVLNNVKIRFRPQGSHKPVSINDDGHGTQNVAHLYYNGKSSQFQLRKASDNSYYFYFYQHFKNAEPKTDGDCVLDVERTKNDESYMKEGQVIHVTDKGTATNKQWKLIPQEDGSYYIQNVRSGLYMSLEDLSSPKENNNKLIQRVAPLKWEIEIVSGTNTNLPQIKKYDSLNFTYNGKTTGSANADTSDSITSLNWMSKLPDTLKITDISIPGTHDVGTCYVHTEQDSMGDQRYYIDEIMNAGVRHLDLRTGLNGNTVRIIHSNVHCLNRDGSELTLNQTLNWIDAFLNANPTETIILQVKMDKDGTNCERETYKILEAKAKQSGGKIWAGNHVPTLEEVRGKIVIISRLDPDSLQTTTPFQLDNGLLWGLECHEWKDSKDKATALTASGSNYEVWTQDNWSHSASGKKPYIKASLLGNTSDGYTNSTLARYDQAKMLGKDAWVFNYTSCSNGSDTPFKNSKEVHQWLYDRSDYSSNDRLVCNDTFTGVMAFDYVDELMAKHIYRTNFNRQYVTIHGVNVGGQIDQNIKPLTIYVGQNETAYHKLFENGTIQSIIKTHFNIDSYLIRSATDGNFLTEQATSITDQDLNTAVETFSNHVRSGNVPSDVYVHLKAIVPCPEDEHGWGVGVITTPPTCKDKGIKTSTCAKCGSTKTEDVEPDDNAHVTYTEEDVTTNSATCEEGGKETQYEICSLCDKVVNIKRIATEPLGHAWEDPTYAWSDDHSTATATHVCARCGVEEAETVDAKSRVIEENTCEDEGSIAYSADFANEGFDMQEAMVSIPALGHDWDEGVIIMAPTATTPGVMTSTCKRCNVMKAEIVPAVSPGSSTVEIGATYSIGGQSYKTTSPNTVTFVEAINAKSVKVPDAVILADGKAYKVTEVSAKAFMGSKIRTVTVGKNVAKLAKGALSKSKATKLVVKTKKLKKSTVKGSLKGSKVKTVKVKVGSKETNKTYVKKYKKIFTKKICGKKVKVQ